MTFVEVVLVGLGALLVSSALDNTPIRTTFQKIISGQGLNIAGIAPPIIKPGQAASKTTSATTPPLQTVTL